MVKRRSRIDQQEMTSEAEFAIVWNHLVPCWKSDKHHSECKNLQHRSTQDGGCITACVILSISIFHR